MEAEGGLLRDGPRQRPEGDSQCLFRPFQGTNLIDTCLLVLQVKNAYDEAVLQLDEVR